MTTRGWFNDYPIGSECQIFVTNDWIRGTVTGHYGNAVVASVVVKTVFGRHVISSPTHLRKVETPTPRALTLCPNCGYNVPAVPHAEWCGKEALCECGHRRGSHNCTGPSGRVGGCSVRTCGCVEYATRPFVGPPRDKPAELLAAYGGTTCEEAPVPKRPCRHCTRDLELHSASEKEECFRAWLCAPRREPLPAPLTPEPKFAVGSYVYVDSCGLGVNGVWGRVQIMARTFDGPMGEWKYAVHRDANADAGTKACTGKVLEHTLSLYEELPF